MTYDARGSFRSVDRKGGRSPINDQNRALIAALEREFKAHGPSLPIYWGNRNWHPMLTDTLRRMQADGVRHALALTTSLSDPIPCAGFNGQASSRWLVRRTGSRSTSCP